MAFTFVQDSGDSNTTSNPEDSFSATPTDGNLLVIVFQSRLRDVADVTLPAGYTARVAADDPEGGLLIIADRIAATTGKPQTLTMAGGAGVNWDLYIAEFAGVAASGYFDKKVETNYGTVGDAQPGSLTPDNSTELLIAAARTDNNLSSESIDSGFSLRQSAPLDRLYVGYKIKTNATAENPLINWSGTSDAYAAMVAYSATAISGATARPDRHLPRGVARGVTRGVT